MQARVLKLTKKEIRSSHCLRRKPFLMSNVTHGLVNHRLRLGVLSFTILISWVIDCAKGGCLLSSRRILSGFSVGSMNNEELVLIGE